MLDVHLKAYKWNPAQRLIPHGQPEITANINLALINQPQHFVNWQNLKHPEQKNVTTGNRLQSQITIKVLQPFESAPVRSPEQPGYRGAVFADHLNHRWVPGCGEVWEYFEAAVSDICSEVFQDGDNQGG